MCIRDSRWPGYPAGSNAESPGPPRRTTWGRPRLRSTRECPSGPTPAPPVSYTHLETRQQAVFPVALERVDKIGPDEGMFVARPVARDIGPVSYTHLGGDVELVFDLQRRAHLPVLVDADGLELDAAGGQLDGRAVQVP